jgi:hypothetical protein
MQHSHDHLVFTDSSVRVNTSFKLRWKERGMGTEWYWQGKTEVLGNKTPPIATFYTTNHTSTLLRLIPDHCEIYIKRFETKSSPFGTCRGPMQSNRIELTLVTLNRRCSGDLWWKIWGCIDLNTGWREERFTRARTRTHTHARARTPTLTDARAHTHTLPNTSQIFKYLFESLELSTTCWTSVLTLSDRITPSLLPLPFPACLHASAKWILYVIASFLFFIAWYSPTRFRKHPNSCCIWRWTFMLWL